MAEEMIFDASLKKKKKKKTGFNLENLETENVPIPEEPSVAPSPVQEPAPDIDGDMDFLKKKKKKKSKTFNLDELNDALPEDGAVGGTEDVTSNSVNMEQLDMDFSKMKKKPKTKAKLTGLDDLLSEDKGKDTTAGKENEAESWDNSDRDYTYEELLQRAFSILKEKNPNMVTGENKKFVMKPPQVVRIGSKKTAFANFSDICRLMHRIPKHLLQFLLAELGTSGSIDGNNQLIIKGRFQQKQIENVLKRYIKEYVTCHTCKSPNTILQKDARLYFLQCEQCNSRCSVAPIRSGFQAVANKQQRQAIRASKN